MRRPLGHLKVAQSVGAVALAEQSSQALALARELRDRLLRRLCGVKRVLGARFSALQCGVEVGHLRKTAHEDRGERVSHARGKHRACTHCCCASASESQICRFSSTTSACKALIEPRDDCRKQVSSRAVQPESAATHLKLHGEPLRNVLGLSRATLLGGKLRLEPADLRPLIQLITE